MGQDTSIMLTVLFLVCFTLFLPTLAQANATPAKQQHEQWEIERIITENRAPPRNHTPDKGQVDAVIFQPLSQFRLSLSTYQVTSMMSLAPYDKAAIDLLQYSVRFLYDYERSFNSKDWNATLTKHLRTFNGTYSKIGTVFHTQETVRLLVHSQLKEAERATREHLKKLDLLRDHPTLQPSWNSHPERKTLTDLLDCVTRLTVHQMHRVDFMMWGTRLSITTESFCLCMEDVWTTVVARMERICPEGYNYTQWKYGRRKREAPDVLLGGVDNSIRSISNPIISTLLGTTAELCAQNTSAPLCRNLLRPYPSTKRTKRSLIFDIIFGGIMYSKYRYTKKTMNQLKDNMHTLYKNQQNTAGAIEKVVKMVNLTMVELGEHRRLLRKLDTAVIQMEQDYADVRDVLEEFDGMLEYSRIITNSLVRYGAIQSAMGKFRDSSAKLASFMNSVADQHLTPALLDPEQLREVLLEVQTNLEDTKKTRLSLPQDPQDDVWSYYKFLRIIPTVVYGSLIVTLEIPLADVSTHLNLYRAREFPLIHPQLKMQFTYDVEPEFIALDDQEEYYMLPPPSEVMACQASQGNWCRFSSPMRATKHSSECIVSLITHNHDDVERNCRVKIRQKAENTALELYPHVWIISLMEPTPIVTGCLDNQDHQIAKPPYTIYTLHPSCMAHIGNNLYLPPSTQLSSSHNYDFTSELEGLQPLLTYHEMGDFRLFGNDTFHKLTPDQVAALQTSLSTYDTLPLGDVQVRLQPINEDYPEEPGLFGGLPGLAKNALKIGIPLLGGALGVGLLITFCWRYKLWTMINCAKKTHKYSVTKAFFERDVEKDESSVRLELENEESRTGPASARTPSAPRAEDLSAPATRSPSLVQREEETKLTSARPAHAPSGSPRQPLMDLRRMSLEIAPAIDRVEEVRRLKSQARVALDRAQALRSATELDALRSLPATLNQVMEPLASMPTTVREAARRAREAPSSLPFFAADQKPPGPEAARTKTHLGVAGRLE